VHDVADTDGMLFLYHLALHCAALPASDPANDVQLLIDRSDTLHDLRGAVMATTQHRQAHPDDPRLVAAHELLVDALTQSLSRRSYRSVA
jgi:hypothetical protein